MTQLTREQLQLAIQCIANTSVPVSQSNKLIEVINVMSKMIDEMDKPVEEKKPVKKKK